MTAIETIDAIVATGTTATVEIAKELDRCGFPPPATDGWTARDVARRQEADEDRRLGLR